jgi:hypothetical protein
MICDQAGAILDGLSEAAKNYVMRGKDRVMSWAISVAQRPALQCHSFHSQAGRKEFSLACEWKMWN